MQEAPSPTIMTGEALPMPRQHRCKKDSSQAPYFKYKPFAMAKRHVAMLYAWVLMKWR
jgi:hypothetical protein